MSSDRSTGSWKTVWSIALVIGALAAAGLATPALADTSCGLEPCPGTLPAIWPHPSKTANDTVRILGWNLEPATTYEVVLVQPDGVPFVNGTVTTDDDGGILGRFEGASGQPFVCAPPIPILEGIYEVRLYPYPWIGSLDVAPVAATTFYHN